MIHPVYVITFEYKGCTGKVYYDAENEEEAIRFFNFDRYDHDIINISLEELSWV